jgi:hypothetical protein
MGAGAREAAAVLRDAPADQRSDAIRAIADHFGALSEILAANAQDVAEATRWSIGCGSIRERLEAMAARDRGDRRDARSRRRGRRRWTVRTGSTSPASERRSA